MMRWNKSGAWKGCIAVLILSLSLISVSSATPQNTSAQSVSPGSQNNQTDFADPARPSSAANSTVDARKANSVDGDAAGIVDDFSSAHKNLLLVGSVSTLYCLMLLLGRRLKRHHGVNLTWTYHIFALCLAIYFPSKLLLDDRLPVKILGDEFHLRRTFGAVMCFLGGLFIIALVDRYIWELYFRQKHRVKIPKFFSEIVTLAIITISIFVILAGYGYTFHHGLGFIIAPSVLAVVLGLAMQDLLGNIISGLALQFGKSFKDGDWLLINDKYAKVIDINWRSTRMLTMDHISIDVPNRDMAKQTITNLNLPTHSHAMRLSVNLEYSAPPTRVKEILLHAASNAKGVSPNPKPSVYLKTFGDSAIEYEVKFWMDNHDYYFEVCDAIRTNMWYSLKRNGIKIPFPIRTVQVERPSRDKEQEIQNSARVILRQQPMFKSLTDIQLDALLPRGRVVHFGSGEKLIQQGDEGNSMFVLVDGESNVVVERNGHPTHVASLRSGDCFGEMSLLTGERRSATIMAHTDCEVVEIGKAVLARSLRENHDLLEKLGSLLARRQMETEGIVAANTKASVVEATQTAYANGFMAKLSAFFEL